MHFGGLDDDRKDSTAPHITFRPQLGGHRQRGLAICTFHLGFSLEDIVYSGYSHERSKASLIGAVGMFQSLVHTSQLGNPVAFAAAVVQLSKLCNRTSSKPSQ